MFLFGKLEKAAKVGSLFQNKDREKKAPAARGGGGGGGDGGGKPAETPEGAKTAKPGEKLPAPDTKALSSLFQGMVDPAMPEGKKARKKAPGEPGDSGGAADKAVAVEAPA